MPTVQERQYLTIGEGTIDPNTRIANGELTETVVEDFITRLYTDEFYTAINAELIPIACVDGRGTALVGPNAAGGTFSLVMGDALTGQAYREAGETAPEHAERYFKELVETGLKIGGHDDEHAAAPNCGCGAEDKLDAHELGQPSILEYITRRGVEVRTILTSLGIEISDDLHNLIVGRAQGLRDENYATSGDELRTVTKKVGGEGSVATLPGSHREAVVVVNTKEGSTLNRQLIHDEYNGAIQAFNLDVPALQKGAEALATSVDEAMQRFVGALYYNVATAAVLAGPGLRIVVR